MARCLAAQRLLVHVAQGHHFTAPAKVLGVAVAREVVFRYAAAAEQADANHCWGSECRVSGFGFPGVLSARYLSSASIWGLRSVIICWAVFWPRRTAVKAATQMRLIS